MNTDLHYEYSNDSYTSKRQNIQYKIRKNELYNTKIMYTDRKNDYHYWP